MGFGWGLLVFLSGMSLLEGPLQASESTRLRSVIQALRQSPLGVQLLDHAHQRAIPIAWGEVSRTDALLTRSFDSVTGKEKRERKITVYLRQDQDFGDQVIDLAHELTHALYSPGVDPYDPTLNYGRYLLATIEGPGGEADAMLNECQVSRDLRKRFPELSRHCRRYWNEQISKLDRVRILKDFYAIGKYYSKVADALAQDQMSFAYLSAAEPRLVSSTGGAPYPMSLLAEYRQLVQIACQNSRNRLEESGSLGRRNPASVEQIKEFLHAKCSAEFAKNRVTPRPEKVYRDSKAHPDQKRF